MASSRRVQLDAVATTTAGLVLSVTAAVLFGRSHDVGWAATGAAAALGVLPALLAALALVRRVPPASTPADRVTLARTVLACACGAIVGLVALGGAPPRTWWLFALVVPTLLLDALDGLVARRTGTATQAGALLDMQVDAGVLLVLSVAVASFLGPWVLLIGLARYLFVAASWTRPTLRRRLPRSQFRRVVAGTQGAVLAAALAPAVPVTAARPGVLLALALLAVSFGTQVVALERRRCG